MHELLCGEMKLTKCHFTDGTKGFIIEETVLKYEGEPEVRRFTITRSTFPTDLMMEKEVGKEVKSEGEPQGPEAPP